MFLILIEFAFDWGKVYLSTVMDLCNKQIIGYYISRRPNFDQIKNMMSSAFEGRKIVDRALFHSDQGWQYQMKEFQEMLSDLGLRQSMSRKGNCHDNAVMETSSEDSRSRCSTARRRRSGTTKTSGR